MSKHLFTQVYKKEIPRDPGLNKNFIEESERPEYCNADSLKQYKQLTATYKTLYADVPIIKNVIRENSVEFLEYYLDNGLDIFAAVNQKQLYYLKYVVEHNQSTLMRFIIDYHNNPKIKTRQVKTCDLLMDHAVIHGRLTFVKMFISIGMRFDASRLLELFLQQAEKIHGCILVPTNGMGRFSHKSVPGHKADKDTRFNDAVLKAAHNNKHIKTIEVDKKVPYISKKDIAKMHIFLVTMAEKETPNKTLPLELYHCLDGESSKLYLKAGFVPSNFTQLIKYYKDKKIFDILIPHTIMEYNRLYIRFIGYVENKLDYVTSILTRSDASRIIHECCESSARLDETSMELLEFYYEHAPTLVHRIVRPTPVLIKWASDRNLNMHYIITELYSTLNICELSHFGPSVNVISDKNLMSNYHIDQIVEHNLMTNDLVMFDYNTRDRYGKLRPKINPQLFKDVFQSELPITYYKNSLCAIAIQSCIANDYYDHLEYFIQFIPNGMTNATARYFLAKDEEMPDSLKPYIDAACLTKPACSK